MNITNLTLEKITSPVPDWIIKGDIIKDDGTVLATFGNNGTSLNNWWNQQSDDFQRQYVSIFITIMAEQMVI